MVRSGGSLRRTWIIILRKEVIQPQVPLRLPCYDLVPIDRFIFGACKGDFGCPDLSWLDGRCVQGSGTHSPQCCRPAITSDSNFTKASCSLRSELRHVFWDL